MEKNDRYDSVLAMSIFVPHYIRGSAYAGWVSSYEGGITAPWDNE